MSNGYLVAASADVSTAHEIAEGFGLDVIDAASVGDHDATGAALAASANVGLILSAEAAQDEVFVALLRSLAGRLQHAQLIATTPEARAAFDFLPQTWPVMSLEDARTRSGAMARQRGQGESEEPARAEPLPPAATPEVAPEPPAPPVEEHVETLEGRPDETLEQEAHGETESEAPPANASDPAPSTQEEAHTSEQAETESESEAFGGAEEGASVDNLSVGELDAEPPPEPQRKTAEPPEPEAAAPEPESREPQAAAPEPQAPAPSIDPPPMPPSAPEPQAPAPAGAAAPPLRTAAPSAPADATAFAPKKLRRSTPELVRIVVHQPKDLNDVVKAARKADPRSEPASSGMPIGDIALGATIGVALEARGASGDGALQRRTWTGEPIAFSYAIEADPSVKQVVLLARVFVNDAQIGVLAFTRNVSGPAKKPHSIGDRVRLKRHKRVFLSYSSSDRETVSQIATAYEMAGVEHFWDRASLKSGEEWHPRLRREIDRADLFHLCWSKAAADSEWVQKETEHALTRRRRHSGKPEITVQMLDGPPWAPHPPELDAINFDDFVRAAIVGYARGEG
jgi:hypothetical protein